MNTSISCPSGKLPNSVKLRGGWLLRRPRSFKVTDFGTNRKLIYDFLSLINSNLPPIWHRFQVMVQFSLARGECLTLTLSLGVIPYKYRRKWYITKNVLVYIFAAESIRVSSTIFTQSAEKATEFSEITQLLGLLRRSRSFKVTEFGTNRKRVCDFLLVINRNLPPILHCFRDIASQRSKIDIFFNTLWFNPPTEGFPRDDLRKILPGCRQVTNVLNSAETLPKISIGWVGCTNVTDRRQTDRRQTDDRQTDGRWHIANMNMSSRSLKGGWLAVNL